MRIAVAATPAVAIPTLEWLNESEHLLAAVITQPDRPAGRGRVLTQTKVAEWANQQSLPLIKSDSFPELEKVASSVDLLITIGYGVILPPNVLDAPRYGCINLHFSLLPSWRGAAPVQRSIEARDALTGVTVFAMDEGMDTGPIFSQLRFALDSDITSDELFLELSELGVVAIQNSLFDIENGVKPKAQSLSGISHAKKLSKAEGLIDWDSEAETVSAKIRAFTSNPGAWTTFRGNVMKIDKVEISKISIPAKEIIFLDGQLLIGTSTYALNIQSLTPSGKTTMKGSDWARGARLIAGESCG